MLWKIYPMFEQAQKIVEDALKQAEGEVMESGLKALKSNLIKKAQELVLKIDQTIGKVEQLLQNPQGLQQDYPGIDVSEHLSTVKAFLKELKSLLQEFGDLPVTALREYQAKVRWAFVLYETHWQKYDEDVRKFLRSLEPTLGLGELFSEIGNKFLAPMLGLSNPALFRSDANLDAQVRHRASQIIKEKVREMLQDEDVRQTYYDKVKGDLFRAFGDRKFLYIPAMHPDGFTSEILSTIEKTSMTLFISMVDRFFSSRRFILRLNRAAIKSLKELIAKAINIGDQLHKNLPEEIKSKLASWVDVRIALLRYLDSLMKIDPQLPETKLREDVPGLKVTDAQSATALLIQLQQVFSNIRYVAVHSNDFQYLADAEKLEELWKTFAQRFNHNIAKSAAALLRDEVSRALRRGEFLFHDAKEFISKLEELLRNLYDKVWDAFLTALTNFVATETLLAALAPQLQGEILTAEQKATILSRKGWEDTVNSIMGVFKQLARSVEGGFILFFTINPEDFALLGTPEDVNKKSCFLQAQAGRGIPVVLFTKNLAVCFIYSVPLQVAQKMGWDKATDPVEISEGEFNQVKGSLKPLARFMLTIENGVLSSPQENTYYNIDAKAGGKIKELAITALRELGQHALKGAEDTEWFFGHLPV